MPIYMDLPEVLKEYEGCTLTNDIIKKIIYRCTPRHHEIGEYYKHD